MSALRRAVQRLQEIENCTPQQIEEQKKCLDSLEVEWEWFCCWTDEWCDHHDGTKPNRCERCCVYTYGEFCPKCLHNISPFKKQRRVQVLTDAAHLPRKSRTFIQM